MTKKMSVICGPFAANKGGRIGWKWKVQQAVDGADPSEVEYESKNAARKVAHDAILRGIAEGFTVYGRMIDQSGGGDEGTYHPDGRVTGRARIPADPDYVGPRCFELPYTPEERKARAKVRRAPPTPRKARPKKEAPPPKKRTPRKAKAPEAPKKTRKKATPKPKPAAKKRAVSLGEQYLLDGQNLASAVAWIKSHKPVQLAAVVKFVNANGTAAEKQTLARARKVAKGELEMPKGRKPAPKLKRGVGAPKKGAKIKSKPVPKLKRGSSAPRKVKVPSKPAPKLKTGKGLPRRTKPAATPTPPPTPAPPPKKTKGSKVKDETKPKAPRKGSVPGKAEARETRKKIKAAMEADPTHTPPPSAEDMIRNMFGKQLETMQGIVKKHQG